MSDITRVLQRRAQQYPQLEAVLYLENGELETQRLTYGQLDEKARALASELFSSSVGPRVLLLYPPGVEFITALAGCWYAGVCAVPVPCPPANEFEKQLEALKSIAKDADIAAVLTLDSYLYLAQQITEKKILLLPTDQIDSKQAKSYKRPRITKETIAYLQYTSGSTSQPKAVVISHGNLQHSIKETLKAWHYTKDSITLNWAPHTHVYGLVCGLLLPLYHGTRAIIMPPAAFINRPLVWLNAISKYQVTHSGCPNFGYDLCVKHISEDALSQLNLSHWQVAVNGGDNVLYETLTAFTDKFKRCGFALNHFSSAYGMSELAGAIAVTPFAENPKYEEINGLGLFRPIVSSGRLLPGLRALSVSPESGMPQPDGAIGEIWIAGPSVAQGYWQRPEETSQVFHAQVRGKKGFYFRTGDLGFIRNKEIYLTGRLKEILVIYGKKYYPLDFEMTISKALTPWNIRLPQVVFSTEISGRGAVIAVQEIPEGFNRVTESKIREAIHHAIAKHYSVDLHEVILSPQGSLPKTGSGKLQRKKVQTLFQENKLAVLKRDTVLASISKQNSQKERFFIALIAQVLQIDEAGIDLDAPLSHFKLDSITIAQLTTALNEAYQLNLSPAIMYEYSTLGHFYEELLAIKSTAPENEPAPVVDESHDIAIIGMGGVFPKAEDLTTFWENLSQGRDCISEVPAFRWDWQGLTCQWGGFIEGLEYFDAPFFNISPHEAELMDPQQRIFLQTVWKTIEDAGYDNEVLALAKTGLFVGVFNHDYAELVQQNALNDAYLTTSIMNSMIANRISYILNFTGPSEAIDTACSSSLVAVHQAVQAILQGDCELAIAGGVNALITPSTFVSASKAGMLSEDGRCKTFDKRANGYVRSEGAGAILLKRLSKALADKDVIHGIIKGTAVNHGGHVNTLTAPNPNAQAEVVMMACHRAQIGIESIQYIETHGTGTPVGDPIEVNGLKKAFQQLAKEQGLSVLPKHYCGLGALKTHIGHLESAAGIAGIIKVLLALRHEKIPANLHLNELNPYIELKESPFYILDKETPWPRHNGLPRRAGISSFGYGGVNAHVIIEEGPRRTTTTSLQSPYLMTLSAHTKEALHQKIKDLLFWLELQKEPLPLAAMSYTLNVGRQHFSIRAAFVVAARAELKHQLKSALQNEHYEQLFSTHENSALNEIGRLYLQKQKIDWHSLYGDFKERVALPTYPFAKQPFWIEVKPKSFLHSLIDANPSDAVFTKRFSGDEFYLQDHQVNAEPVLPGSVSLEMVRAAASHYVHQPIRQIVHIQWLKPINSDALRAPLQVRLTSNDRGLSFSLSHEAGGAFVTGEVRTDQNIPIPSPLNYKELSASLTKQQRPEQVYEYFKQAGLNYGKTFQVIKNIRHDAQHLWAEIAFSSPLSETKDWILHPCILDGVLQTTQALLKDRETLYFPFSIAAIYIFKALPEHCYVSAQLIAAKDSQQLPVFNIQVTDENGHYILKIDEFMLCAVNSPKAAIAYYHCRWLKQPGLQTSPISDTGSMIVLGADNEAMQQLKTQFAAGWSLTFSGYDLQITTVPDHILIVMNENKPGFSQEIMAQELQNTYYLIHRLVMQLVSLKPGKQVNLLCVSSLPSPFFRALAGYAKTVHQEHAYIKCRLIETPDLKILAAELGQHDLQVRYDENNQRYLPDYEVVHSPISSNPVSLRKSGVYLITGGLGGLGYLFAQYLAEHYQAKLILTGRSPVNVAQQEKINDLEKKGATVLYLQTDVGQQPEVNALITQIKDLFGNLHGILHSAGVISDRLLAQKTEEEMASVLAAKVAGTCHLHEATRQEHLDFLVLFSSVAAVFGNLGQCDYAYANCFLDEFAKVREQERKQAQCFGHTLSINWPLWEEGGLKIAAEYQGELARKLGITSLSTVQGIQAFLHVLANPQPQYIVLPGQQEKLLSSLKKAELIPVLQRSLPDTSGELFFQKTSELLKKIIAEALKSAPERIEIGAPFEQYGIDSLMIIQLNERLERVFDELPRTLFFEYQNLGDLSNYFITHHQEKLNSLFATQQPVPMPVPLMPRSGPGPKAFQEEDKVEDEIAIIGVSGSYPQAKNLADFWENLKAGKDCITEIPAERWSIKDYFDTNQDRPGKTYSKWGGFLVDVDKFDPLFFNISPREATLMDPQERLFLQTAWSTIEDAGYPREQLAGKKVGVYVGVMYGQYQLFAQPSPTAEDFVPTNSVFASIANRVSYFFNFHGPSMALDTMCSSSLTAIHLACQSLREGECQLALAGGVNLTLHPNKYLLLSQGKFLASDGHCRSFGEHGDGYVPSEGVGAILLKPLKQAMRDGDHIYAVIKGSQLNHGGKTNGYTVPNPNAQAELIAETYQRAQVNPRDVSYIEAHGTGTALGDPIEIAGLNKVFASLDPEYSCAIGSVKSNIGHCESAAGIAAVTKVLLQLHHQILVPSILAKQLNANINWSTTPFKVQQTLEEWSIGSTPKKPKTRIAGVSSFGAGGANAHLILAEAEEVIAQPEEKPAYLFTLSAKTKQALVERQRDLWEWLKNNPLIHPEWVAYTLNAGRSHFNHRRAFVVTSIAEAIRLLEEESLKPVEGVFMQEHEPTSPLDNKALADLMHHLQQGSNYRGDLLSLARLYVAGYNPDWEQLHTASGRRKISLPTYPFAKERYWYSDVEKPDVPLASGFAAQVALADKITAFLIGQVTKILQIKAHQLDSSVNLGDYGMDSVHFIELGKQIADFYQIEFTPAVFYTANSIATISQHLMQHFASEAARAHEVVSQTVPKSISSQVSNKTWRLEPNRDQSIAIIGMAGLFPQSENLADFWEHLHAGHDLITEIPPDRWQWQDYYGEGPDKSNSKWGGFINKADHFDAGFFNISAREASLMDPQQRLFLEVVWNTLEDAGYNPFMFAGKKIGVFAGVEFSEYQTLIAQQHKEFHGFIATGNSHSMIANRVSYFFNLQGPSEAIDTACSSSLVAIHRAVQAIHDGECEMALAGGVSLILNPDTLVVTSQLGALSADGHCKTFDKTANGYVKGEGVASILLKPLEQAQADGDHIYGIIRASAVNHGGKAQSLTAPNASAQSDLLLGVYHKADIAPETVTYIETHGTGTALGDPVEIEGLKQAFQALLTSHYPTTRIALGSVKTNIGHLEPASGIAGVIKLLLAMAHEKLPGILHFKELNPYIHLNDTPFYLVEQTQDWIRIKDDQGQEVPLRAGVSSFGFGGTNAHLVMEEGRPYQRASMPATKPYYLIALSAKHEDSLQQKIKDLHQWVLQHQEFSLADLSCTLGMGRAHFLYRCALVVATMEELTEALDSLIKGEMPEFYLFNEGQTCSMRGPVFDEVYQSALKVVQQPENPEQYRHKLFILADLYTKHYAMDWHELYQDDDVRRVPGLPAYPFIKQRYWYDLELTPTIGTQVTSSQATPEIGDWTSQALTYLRQVFAEKLRTAPEHIQIDETYEVYGVDSIIGLEITNRLEQDFGPLPKTLLYERNRLKDLAQYFIKNHQQKLAALVVPEAGLRISAAPVMPEAAAKPEFTAKQIEQDDIAIIGLSGIFPMANTMDEFWHNLVSGRDCVGEVPSERWNYKEYPVLMGAKEKYFPHGGFIPDVDKFDPLFFNISPRDAGLMDPQERLFMQSAWSTLEDAGYTREKLKKSADNSVGVFAGVTYNFYPLFIAEEWQKGNRVPLDIQTFSVANRISYFMDWRGPSFVVDTACSSSLAAIHLACESIRRGECAMALAGGVNLSLHPSKYHFLGSFSFMSENGRCTSFAEGGTGYVPSEGVGSVLLKPLRAAIADNDLIYGVIKSSSMNHGGKTSGYTVPNPNAQAEVILRALDAASIDPRTISYIEAHGTGTALGDPIEIRGLQEAFEVFTQEKQYCAIGSVKSNIGHLESAAGISQLAKVLLQMRHQKLVPTLHAEKLNPFIDFANSPFYVQRELQEWQPAENGLRRAGISSFGAGGTNVHVIVEEYVPNLRNAAVTVKPFIFLLSAFNEERLAEKVQQMQHYLQAHQQESEAWLSDVCYTLQTGREHMEARLGILADTQEELLEALARYPQNKSAKVQFNFQIQKPMSLSVDLAQLVENKRYAELVEQWVLGAQVDWDLLYPQQKPGLISLPTYPFAKRRCWIPVKEAVSVPESRQEISQEFSPPPAPIIPPAELVSQEWLYKMQWEEISLLKEEPIKCSGKWLIFSDFEQGLLLQQQFGSDACVYCFSGEQFMELDDRVFYINASLKSDYQLLFKAIQTKYHQELLGVIYLGSFANRNTEPDSEPSLSLLHLFKAMMHHSWPHQLLFTLITFSAQATQADEPMNIWQHHLWSMTRIFAAEQASYQVLLLDIPINYSLQTNAKFIAQEIEQQKADQNHIAYRGETRYSLRFAPVAESAKEHWRAPTFALITGGLGALGVETAKFLLAQGTRFLLLTGMTELSAQTTEKNDWLHQLQQGGAQVKYVAVDVSNKEKMQQVINEAESLWQQPVDGVFHLAGVTTDNVPLEQMEENLWRDVLSVKIKGALVLHELLMHNPLSCFILFSSIAAVPHFGMAGLSAYAAANEFLNGLAWHRRSLQLPAVSINWVAWAEKGMSHRHNHDAFLGAIGMASLNIKEGMALLLKVLELNPAEIIVCAINWKKFLQVNAGIKKLDFFTHFLAQQGGVSKNQITSLSPEQITELVRGLCAKALALEPHELSGNTPFQHYGMDSIIGISFSEELGVHFPDVVSPTDLYRYPTLEQLTQFIIQQVHTDEKEPILAEEESVDLDQLSEEELKELLESELKDLEQLT